MKRVFFVKLRNTVSDAYTWSGEVVAETAEKAIAKAKTQAKNETGEPHELVERLKHRGEAV